MKKLSAILLIALFLFNFFGYRLIFNYAQQQSDVILEASLDKNEFNEAELITIKVPLSLPYQNNQENFTRVDGEIKLNGKIYKYVKRKFANGQLTLLCLPDHEKMKLQSEKDEFFKYSNDLVQNHTSKKSDHSKTSQFKNLLGEYDDYVTEFKAIFFTKNVVLSLSNQSNLLPSSPHCSPEQPPEVI